MGNPVPAGFGSPSSFSVTYLVEACSLEEAEQRAKGIALEQTVELSDSLIPAYSWLRRVLSSSQINKPAPF